MSDYREVINNVWVKDNIVSKFNDLECVIFDCDGTLVNINNSYNACIKHTTGFILEKMTGRKTMVRSCYRRNDIEVKNIRRF